jgi:2-methylcitrate dehydratase PrpD
VKEYDLEMGAVNKRLPGRKIEMEDGGVKYTREVELPNGHKWRQRADGGWCRFSKKTCYPSTKQSKGQQQALAQNPP